MFYRSCQFLYAIWLNATWSIWRRHRAWAIINGADFDDPYEIAFLHAESFNRGDILLSVQLEALLGDIGVETTIIHERE